MNRIIENKALFSKEIIELYEIVDRDQRNKVTYRRENGAKYQNIKKLAKLLIGIIWTNLKKRLEN